MKRSLLSVFTLLFCVFSFASQDLNTKLLTDHINSILPQNHSVTFKVTSSSSSKGVTYVYGIQTFESKTVMHTEFNASIKNNAVLTFNHTFILNIENRRRTQNAILPSHSILSKLFTEHRINKDVLASTGLHKYSYTDPAISEKTIKMEQKFLLKNGVLQNVYSISFYQLDHLHWFNYTIDASNGLILGKTDWVTRCSVCHKPKNSKNTTAIASPIITESAKKNASSSYTVFAMPLESPNHGSRSAVEDPFDLDASPYGWHDTNAVAGHEFTITRGNNVYASEDEDANNQPGYSPDGGSNLVFDYPFDVSKGAHLYRDASITSLFYWNNLMHDVWWHYGFDEESGNFQSNNYNNGGLGDDYVQADAVDGSGTDNANMATPPDGENPRMQMYLWNVSIQSDFFQVNSPSNATGKYASEIARFGPRLSIVPITADLVLADVGTGGAPERACSALANASAMAGKIALIERGSCTFVTKVVNAQNAGAVAVVIYDSTNNNPTQMGGNDGSITIPSIMIGRNDGLFLKGLLSSGTVNVSLYDSTILGDDVYDSDFDAGIIAHEYTHGISNRLTGGPANSDCLQNEEQMGEGWSDFFGLVMTHEVTDEASDLRGIGTYADGEDVDGGGIRTYPYSVDMNASPYTYDDIKSLSVPHGVGSVWCSMLWDLYWAMIDKHGYDPNIYTGTGGNNMAMQLVIDGMKLQKCNPGFVDGRKGILLADSIANNGANQRLIWEVFARRGLGVNADQGSDDDRGDGEEDFELPEFLNNIPVIEKRAFTTTTNGDSLVYTLVVKNFTDSTMTNIEVVDSLDSNVRPQGSLPCNMNYQNGVITYTIPSLNANDSFDCSFKVRTKFLSTSTLIDSDDVEGGTNDWNTTQDAGNTNWGITNNQANSGSNSWYAPNEGSATDFSLSKTFYVTGDNPVIVFDHLYDTETEWDGGVIEVRKPGEVWADAEDLFISNGYNARIETNPASAISNQLAFTGNSGTFITSQINVKSFAEDSCEIRFRFVSDAAQGGNGWYIDDIELIDLVQLRNTMEVNYNDEHLTSTVSTVINGEAYVAGIEDVFANEIPGLSVYPNPSSTVFTISTEVNNAFEYQLSDPLGALITEGRATGKAEVSVQYLATGVYILQVSSNGRRQTVKLIKE